MDVPIFTPPHTILRPGQALLKVGVYVFRCPLCGNEFRYDDPYEPMCTGPNSTDEHSPEVMRLKVHDTIKAMV